MSDKLSRASRAKSEIRRKTSFTWSEAAIDVRCRLFFSEFDWQWVDAELRKCLTPVEEVHAMSEYSSTEDNLCSVCLQYFLGKDTHQPNGTSLVESANNGCQLCSMILDSLIANNQDYRSILLEHDNPIILELRIEGKTTLTAKYASPVQHNGERRFLAASRRLSVLAEDDTTMLRGKVNAIEFIGKKISECLQNHTRCPKSFEQPFPLRLIDVGSTGGDEIHQPRLWISQSEVQGQAENETEPPCGAYAALSYCWGAVPFLTLTPETYEDLQKKIPMENLPPTLQDAIEITRGLGIRYLWVDSLCIFQGESMEAKSDWSLQSVQMDTIYSQATIVLGVAASSSAYNGIACWPYHYRDIVEIQALERTDQNDGLNRCFIASQEFTSEETLGPLHTRGWAFQERILASRFVHLGREKLFFECDHGRQYEYHGDDCFKYQLCQRLDDRPRFEVWHILVEEYSRKQLTEQMDNLIALSGVAKRFAKLADNPGQYLAGLWEGNLACDLMWYVESPTVKIDVAPSWSWAARRSAVSYRRIKLHVCTNLCATVISTDVTNFPARYGIRCSGQIVVKGYLRKIFLHGEQNRYHVVGFRASRTDPDGQDEKYRMGICFMDLPNAESSLNRLASRFQCDKTRDWENVFETWSLQLHPGRGILLKSTLNAVNEFERIGYFEYEEQRRPMDTKLREEQASNRNPLAQAAYIADHPFGWMRTAAELDQDELIEDWFGDPDAIVTLV